jgi:hypothetical protein
MVEKWVAADDLLDSMVNKVNDGPVSFPAGTVLVVGWKEHPDGRREAELRFKASGWNNQEEIDRTIEEYRVGDPSVPPYPEADFSHLFPVPDPPV